MHPFEIDIQLQSIPNEPSIMTLWSPWPPPLPTHFCSTWDCSAPPTSPTWAKLMHLPFFEWGIMNLGSFSFPDVAVILHLLPILTPTLYHPYRSSIFTITLSLPFMAAGNSILLLGACYHCRTNILWAYRPRPPSMLHPAMLSMTLAFFSRYCSLYSSHT